MNYEESLNYIHSRNKFGIKLGLDATANLLDKIGNPHHKLKFVHIAGTNGKGSTTSYIHDILMAKGYKVGKFISPYVHSFTERIQVNNCEISKSDLAECTTVVRDAIEKHGLTPTEFEVVTAIGLLYFERQSCDYVALEVGMGGRFDATNVIPAPLVSVITSISIDHTEYLGNTIADIAFEKCGIIKTGSKTVAYADNPEDANKVITKTACEKNVPLIITDKKNIKILRQGIDGTDFEYKNEAYHINMLGTHQVYNAVNAIEAVKLLGVDEEFIKKGLEITKFRGRLEIISKDPVIIEDGAHN
ncbi:MAG: bifunctional folylpolyglutamate synthase/dihydrofolate synthase, partial [Clostridia bacterium]|nr:bifunctional folylpolyglutamate synthase/dihydrofolate synthase [Clostridia bacterium]